MLHMRRREFISLLGGAAAISVAGSLPLRAQPQPRVLRVGFVGAQPRELPFYGAFLERMAELGYQEGRNFTFEYIQTPNVEGYATSYREVAARKVDVFLAVGSEPALLAARSAAEGAPIAFLAIDFDPLAKGYVETYLVPEAILPAFSYDSSNSPPNASSSRAKCSHAPLLLESHSTGFRTSNAMRRSRRLAS